MRDSIHCPSPQTLEAYHDRELDPVSRQAVEAHLAWCAACGATLGRLDAMSRLFTSAPTMKLSRIARRRLHDRVDALAEGSLLRIAWTFSGIAASILVAGSFLLTQARAPRQTQGTPAWLEIASATDTNVQTTGGPAQQWYLAGSQTSDAP